MAVDLVLLLRSLAEMNGFMFYKSESQILYKCEILSHCHQSNQPKANSWETKSLAHNIVKIDTDKTSK